MPRRPRLEQWFRFDGGFTYTNRPVSTPGAPLVDFVAQTRAGYCQHFAGAMALMLRYLGVPARVAVGFSSGTYKREQRRPGGSATIRARVGRGVVPRLRLAAVRPDTVRAPGARPAERAVRDRRRRGSPRARGPSDPRPRSRRPARRGAPSRRGGHRSQGGRWWRARRGSLSRGGSLLLLLALLAAALTHRHRRHEARHAARALPSREIRVASRPRAVRSSPTTCSTRGSTPLGARRCTSSRARPPRAGRRPGCVRRRGNRGALRAARRCGACGAARAPRAACTPARRARAPVGARPFARVAIAALVRLRPVRRAVVMAAGEGTRLRPLTERWPKPVLPIDGRAGDRDAPPGARHGGMRARDRRHRPSRRAGRGARRRRLGVRARGALRAAAGRPRLRQTPSSAVSPQERSRRFSSPRPTHRLLAGDVGRFAAAFSAGSAAGAVAVRRGPGTQPVDVSDGLVRKLLGDDAANPLSAAPLWAFVSELVPLLEGLPGPPLRDRRRRRASDCRGPRRRRDRNRPDTGPDRSA